MRWRAVLRVSAVVMGTMALATAGVTAFQAEQPEQTTIVAHFADASPLDPGSEVRSSGVKVGNVRDIRLERGTASVTFTMDPEVLPVHRDARMLIRPVNVLGEHYIELSPGTPSEPYLGADGIQRDHTESQVELQDVLNTFDNPTSTGMAAMVATLGEGMQGAGPQAADAIKALSPAMRNTQQLGSVIGQQDDVLKRLLDRVKPVAQAVGANNGATLNQLVGSTERTLSTASSDRQALDQTLAELPRTLSSARSTLTHLAGVGDAGTPALASVRPVTDNLQAISWETRRFADAADPALASLRPVLEHADGLLDQARPVVAQLRDAGPGLKSVAHSARPLGDQLLDQHLGDLMSFITKWSLSTNGRDALSHYFRGVVHVTPAALNDLLGGSAGSGGERPAPNPGAAPLLPGAKTPLPLPGLQPLPAGAPMLPGPGADQGSATGLSQQQEQSMLGQLLGGR